MKTTAAPQPNLFRLAIALCALAVAARAQSSPATTPESVVQLGTIDVTGRRETAYTPPLTAQGGKASLPLDENPQSIGIVSEAFLADLRPLKLEDALVSVSSVATGGSYSDWDYLRVRGFEITPNDLYIDGLRSGGGWVSNNIETFGLERIEILKGPAALYGSGSAGGLVNLVSQRPSNTTFGRLDFTIGSDDFVEASLDLNRPLDSQKNVLFRLAGYIRDRNSSIDYVGSQRRQIAPSLTWKISDATTLTLLTSYHRSDGRLAWPLPAAGTILPNPNGKISSDLYTGEPDTNNAEDRATRIGAELTHIFNDRFTFQQSVRYEDIRNLGDRFLYPGYLSADESTLYRYWWTWDESAHAFISDSRFTARFGRENFQHVVTAGADYYRRQHDATYVFNWTDGVPLNLFTPAYGATLPPAAGGYAASDRTELTGLYAQDHVTFAHGLTLTFGGRYDFTKIDAERDEALTSRIGATWAYRDDSTAYVNFSESFNAQAGTTVAGTPLQPETGRTFEFGLRQRYLAGRLHTTAAVYEITRRNLATGDLTHPGYYLTTGEQRSRGVEFDARYALNHHWEVLAAYAYIDATVTGDTTIPIGSRLAGVPHHLLNLWTKYTVSTGPLRGLGFGLGFNTTTAQPGDRSYAAPFDLPGYTLWRAGLYYERGPFSMQLNVTNLFDREYYAGSYDRLYVLPGDSRSIRASVGWKF